MKEEILICRKIQIIASAIIEAEKYGQLSPQTIKLLEKLRDEK
jgi:hypothetical protein